MRIKTILIGINFLHVDISSINLIFQDIKMLDHFTAVYPGCSQIINLN